jgi:hypothetical protein
VVIFNKLDNKNIITKTKITNTRPEKAIQTIVLREK